MRETDTNHFDTNFDLIITIDNMGCIMLTQPICSTATLQASFCKEAKQTRDGTPLVNRKRVRFALEVVEHFRKPMGREETVSTWLSQEDFHDMITEASFCAGESRKSKTLISTLDCALREARRASLEAEPISLDFQCLRLWCQYGHNRRGLEKLTSQMHETTRGNVVNKNREKVVALSQSGANAEDIRLASEKYSRSSIVFARIVGLADAEAVICLAPPDLRKLSSSPQRRMELTVRRKQRNLYEER
jgi:hypothetical protein